MHRAPDSYRDSYRYKWRGAILVDGYPVWSRGYETKDAKSFRDELREQATDGEAETDSLFHIPTDSYSIINPIDVYGPLGDVMFGETRRYRGGDEVHMDIMFDDLEVRLPGRSNPIKMGVTSGYDFFGEHAVYVEGVAQDGYCSNTMRSLTDKEVIKHVGDVRNFRTWWEEPLSQVKLVADELFEFIQDGQDIELDFSELPFTVTEFCTLLGFPDYLAEHAAGDAEANAASPFEIDMWTPHSGATYALTHFFQGKRGFPRSVRPHRQRHPVQPGRHDRARRAGVRAAIRGRRRRRGASLTGR